MQAVDAARKVTDHEPTAGVAHHGLQGAAHTTTDHLDMRIGDFCPDVVHDPAADREPLVLDREPHAGHRAVAWPVDRIKPVPNSWYERPAGERRRIDRREVVAAQHGTAIERTTGIGHRLTLIANAADALEVDVNVRNRRAILIDDHALGLASAVELDIQRPVIAGSERHWPVVGESTDIHRLRVDPVVARW